MDILSLTYPLSAILILAAAVGLGIFLTHRFKLGWRLWWIGAATFILSQIGHIPFNQIMTLLFQRGILPTPPPAWSPLFNAVFLGLSAGLWEELARYAMFRWWAKDARSWSKALLLGAGHGGAEAILFGAGLTLLTYIQLVALRGVDLSTVIPPEQLALAQQQIQAYWSNPWPLSLLPFVERIFAMVIQISFAALVLQVFLRGQIRWLWLAVGWHTMVDSIAVLLVQSLGLEGWMPYIIEAFIGGFALVSLGIIFALRQPEPIPPPEEPLPDLKSGQALDLPPIDESLENLDKSRYQ